MGRACIPWGPGWWSSWNKVLFLRDLKHPGVKFVVFKDPLDVFHLCSLVLVFTDNEFSPIEKASDYYTFCVLKDGEITRSGIGQCEWAYDILLFLYCHSHCGVFSHPRMSGTHRPLAHW